MRTHKERLKAMADMFEPVKVDTDRYDMNGNIKLKVYKNRETKKPKPAIVPEGHTPLARPHPLTYSYHYSNQDSQYALICETQDFPDSFNPETEKHFCAYSDRMAQWDRERFKEVCEMIGTGDQEWAQRLRTFNDSCLKEIAKVALDLPVLPKHARFVHHFNVSNGHSCPTIEAIWKTGVTATQQAATDMVNSYFEEE